MREDEMRGIAAAVLHGVADWLDATTDLTVEVLASGPLSEVVSREVLERFAAEVAADPTAAARLARDLRAMAPERR